MKKVKKNNHLIKVMIPLGRVSWINAKAETIWAEVDAQTYHAYISGETGGPYYGILRNDSFSFPKSLKFGTTVSFMLQEESLPTIDLDAALIESDKRRLEVNNYLDQEFLLSGDVDEKIRGFCETVLESGIWYDPIFNESLDHVPEELLKSLLYGRFQDIAWKSLPTVLQDRFSEKYGILFCAYVENYVSQETFWEWYLENEEDLINGRFLRREEN